MLRQLATYASVGVGATAAHYAILIALVEAGGWAPVPATLCGYVVGGIVAYLLNRRHTFASDRPHAEAGWRFGLVAFAGFCVTYLLMSLFVNRFGAPYLPAQVATTVSAMFVTFALNRIWTFGGE
ncbi:GtrA family protein [Methylocystis parvus]|uniref:GtrA family protein n=1 Tax=Methylocystis parvus TaxID=134 RepID=A0A6B8M7U1_9HYPH|nr:GtrA family protein [Methylocystis parvus]QGM98608.1 GtrA family protein [Methylocystis parvus]WBK01049.1 GtrA family protein [Methylocystis parvus OBBP]